VGQCVRMAAGSSARGRRTPDSAAQIFIFVASWSALLPRETVGAHRCDRLLSGVKYVAPCSTACCITARSQMRSSELAQKDRCHRVTVRQPCGRSALALPGFTALGQSGCGTGRLSPPRTPSLATVCTLVARVTSIENRRCRRRCRNSRRRMGTRTWRRL
jgi:hypothetical protein